VELLPVAIGGELAQVFGEVLEGLSFHSGTIGQRAVKIQRSGRQQSVIRISWRAADW
jgi:hypothetical protein